MVMLIVRKIAANKPKQLFKFVSSLSFPNTKDDKMDISLLPPYLINKKNEKKSFLGSLIGFFSFDTSLSGELWIVYE